MAHHSSTDSAHYKHKLRKNGHFEPENDKMHMHRCAFGTSVRAQHAKHGEINLWVAICNKSNCIL